MVAIAAQIVDLLPQIVAVRLNFGEPLGAGPGSPPSMSGLSAPPRQSRHLPVSSFRRGFRKLAPGAAGWKLASIRGEPIFGVADHTSNERSFAHEG
jgi:hypothetical protein